MPFRLIILPPAEDDLTKAFKWYEKQLHELGSEFVAELDLIFAQITSSPRLYQTRYKEFRRALIGRFPYKIWYLIDGEIIVVFAIVHSRRHPDYWKKRL